MFLYIVPLEALESEKHVLNETVWDLYLLSHNGEIFNTSHLAQKGTLHFQAKKTFSGSSGCNIFFGSYKDSQQVLELFGVGMTKKICDEESMNVESVFFMFFRDGKISYILHNDELILERGLTKAVFKRTH